MANTAVTSAGTHGPSRSGWKIGIAVAFIAITLARVVYVSLYAAPIPFWDQWDELNTQYRPWLDGTWHLLQLFAGHMEHRVAFTRLVGMALAAMNGHVFDNLVVAYANAAIYGLLWALVFALLARHAGRGQGWAVLACVIVLGVLPFDWENIVVGFQNQFYFLEISAAVLLALAAYRDASWRLLAWLILVAVASLFTMASGLLAAPAVCAVLVLRAWRGRTRYGFTAASIAAMLVVTALGLLLLMHTRKNAAYHAAGAVELLRGFATALMWPLQPYHPAWFLLAIAVWSPLVFWLWRFARTRTADGTAIFAAGLAIWVLLQCLAIAWSRGHDLNALPWRYTEIPALGLVANLTLALKLAGAQAAPRRWVASAGIVCVAAVTGWIFFLRTPMDLASMVKRYQSSYRETVNVSRYLAGRPLPNLPAMDLDLPYPVAARLKQFLDMPDMRALLPPSLFPPPAARKHAPLSTLASDVQRAVRGRFPAAMAAANRDLAQAPVVFTPFATQLPSADGNRQCALDGIDGHPAGSVQTISRRVTATFDGWAGDGHGRPATQAVLVLQGDHSAYAAPFAPNVSRPDVARAWKKHHLSESGFHLPASAARVAPGTYALYITDTHAADATCNLHRTLTVR